MYHSNDFILSVKVGSNYLPISSFISGQENNLSFVFNENLTEEENSQYTLTFEVADRQYSGSEITFCPFLHLLYIGADLRLEWNYTFIDFVISEATPKTQQNSRVYAFTAKDEVSYRWQKQHLQYSFSTVDYKGDANVQNIYSIARTVLSDNFLLYDPVSNPNGWSVVSFTGDANNDYNNSIGYKSLIDQLFSLEVTDSNPYNVIIEACSTVNAFMKVDYKKRTLDFFRKQDVKDSGYRYRPEYNLLDHSVSYSGEELCTMLHAHGGQDADGNYITIIPPLSFALKKYVETHYEELFPNNDWSDVINEIYQSNTEKLKPEYQPSFSESDVVYEKLNERTGVFEQGSLVTTDNNYQRYFTTDNISKIYINYDYEAKPPLSSYEYSNIDSPYRNCPAGTTDWRIERKIDTDRYGKNVMFQHYSNRRLLEAERPYQCFAISNLDPVWAGGSSTKCSFVLDFCFDSTIDLRISSEDVLFDSERKYGKEGNFIQIVADNTTLDINCNAFDFDSEYAYTKLVPLTNIKYNLQRPGNRGRWKHLIIKLFCDYTYSTNELFIHTDVYYNSRFLGRQTSKKIGPYSTNPKSRDFMTNLFGNNPDLYVVVASSGTEIVLSSADIWEDHLEIIDQVPGYIGDINVRRFSGDASVAYDLPEQLFAGTGDYTDLFFNDQTMSWNQIIDGVPYNYCSLYRANYGTETAPKIDPLVLRRNTDASLLIERCEQNTKETRDFFTIVEKVPYLSQFLMDFSYFQRFNIIKQSDIDNFQLSLRNVQFKHQYETMSLMQAKTALTRYRNELESLAQTYASVIYQMLENDTTEADDDTNTLLQDIKTHMDRIVQELPTLMQTIGPSNDANIGLTSGVLVDHYFTLKNAQTKEQISKYQVLTQEGSYEAEVARENIKLLEPFCKDMPITIKIDGIEYTSAPGAYKLIMGCFRNVGYIEAFPYNLQNYFNLTKQSINNIIQNFYTNFGQCIYEQYYENQDELDSIGLYNQAFAYMADYNKIQGSYTTTVFDIATLDSVGHPKAEVGDFIYVYNPSSMEAFPLLQIINTIEAKQNLLYNYQNNFRFSDITLTQIDALQAEIAALKTEAKNLYKQIYGMEINYYQQILSILYTDKLYITSISRVLREPLKDSITVEEQSRYKNIISQLIKSI